MRRNAQLESVELVEGAEEGEEEEAAAALAAADFLSISAKDGLPSVLAFVAGAVVVCGGDLLACVLFAGFLVAYLFERLPSELPP